MASIEQYNNELYHYGVKGMKWGVRKFEKASADLDKRKSAYKKAKKEYNKAYVRADTFRVAALSPVKKHRQTQDKRWDDVAKKAEKANKLRQEYKSAKKEFNKHTTVLQKVGRAGKKTANYMSTKSNSSREAYNNLGFVGKTAYNVNTAMRGRFTKAMGNALYSIGNAKYNSLNGVGTPGQVAALKGIGAAAQVLKTIGDVQVTTAAIREVRAINKR